MLNFSSAVTLFVLFFVSANAFAIDQVFPGNAKDVEIINSSINDDDTICKLVVQCRLKRAADSAKTANKPPPPVLLQHGIFVDAAPWLWNLNLNLNSQEESLGVGFILSDNGLAR
ncbi:hypothetical protein V6N12_007428 [Hibiscus sabdariffa]|uniref:Triacylglycerol lipase n=1 Tax=Hibiscus sabdariffa TaxID=183260 RepID=A0ABR2F1Q6_9ROSI